MTEMGQWKARTWGYRTGAAGSCGLDQPSESRTNCAWEDGELSLGHGMPEGQPCGEINNNRMDPRKALGRALDRKDTLLSNQGSAGIGAAGEMCVRCGYIGTT